MKRLIALFLIAIMLLVMSSCSTNSVESTSAEILTSETTMAVETESSASAVEEKSMIAEREIKVLDYTDSKKQIFIYRDDVELSGVLYLPDGDGPFPVMIFASAIGSGYEYLEDIAKRLTKNGIATVLFNFAGVAGNDDLTVLTEAEDLKAVIGGVRTLPVIDSSNVFLFGHSFGGLVASYVGCNYPEEIKGMILIEPAYHLKDEISGSDPDMSTIPESILTKRFIEDLNSFDIYDYMPSFKGNVIIFLGTAEGSFGLAWPSLYDKAQEQFPSAELIYVEGADHGFMSVGREDVKQGSIEFIKNNI
ncbi:MAG: alpha/beta fold hydrolase [Clostridiales bacterium]|nr:alpha/beta fold hydrolase [Clostridiales bacterium]